MKKVTWAGLATAGTDVSVAVLYAAFAYAHSRSFLRNPRASVVLIVATEALFAFFILVRAPANRASASAWDWITTVAGTFAPLLLRPAAAAHDLLVGQAIQMAGTCLAMGGVLSLNRSIGLVPAHREVKRHGLYRWVRHPLYGAYTISNMGYLLSNYTHLNAMLVVVALLFQILRIFNEERFLSQYPAYLEYKKQTRWRLFPFLF
jgi:protein-S-isoprenylcysteine O-methyltransferase Ste14